MTFQPDQESGVCVRSRVFFLYVGLYVFPFNLICNISTFKNCFDLLTQPHRSRVCARTEFVHARCSTVYSLLFDMQDDTVFSGKKIDLLTPLQGPMICVRKEYVLAWCSMLHSNQFDMQHDYFQKKNVLTFSPPDRNVLKRVSLGSKDCTKELKLEYAYFLGQTS